MTPADPSLIDVVADGTVDTELAALVWLLVEGGVPVTVSGPASLAVRTRLAVALLSLPPAVPWVLVDADQERPGLGALGARIRGGMRVAITLEAVDLRDTIERLAAPPAGLPDDAIRRLGLVLIVGEAPTTSVGPVVARVRVLAAHYLRPTERDAQGHIQRRPPAVLATWRSDEDRFDHFAWGSTPELADLVDRTQASFEELHAGRAAAVAGLVTRSPATRGDAGQELAAVLVREPARRPAPARTAAQQDSVREPLTDPHVH